MTVPSIQHIEDMFADYQRAARWMYSVEPPRGQDGFGEAIPPETVDAPANVGYADYDAEEMRFDFFLQLGAAHAGRCVDHFVDSVKRSNIRKPPEVHWTVSWRCCPEGTARPNKRNHREWAHLPRGRARLVITDEERSDRERRMGDPMLQMANNVIKAGIGWGSADDWEQARAAKDALESRSAENVQTTGAYLADMGDSRPSTLDAGERRFVPQTEQSAAGRDGGLVTLF